MFIGIGVAIAARAIGNARAMRYRGELPPQHHSPALLEDPRVPHLQAEVEDLRTQVERLAAADRFYAQLNAGAPAAPAAGVPGAVPVSAPAPSQAPSSFGVGERPAE
jgi:hypothetical protein